MNVHWTRRNILGQHDRDHQLAKRVQGISREGARSVQRPSGRPAYRACGSGATSTLPWSSDVV
jgi:hypothetical protein